MFYSDNISDMDTVPDISPWLLLDDLHQFLLVVGEVKAPGFSHPVVVWNRLNLRSEEQVNPIFNIFWSPRVFPSHNQKF